MNGPIDSLIGLDVIDAIVPTDGLLVALAEVFIDESGTHAGSPVMCVGGYLFRKREAREFQREWGKRLAREGLAYWHTNPAMQGHGEAPFSAIQVSMAERRSGGTRTPTTGPLPARSVPIRPVN